MMLSRTPGTPKDQMLTSLIPGTIDTMQITPCRPTPKATTESGSHGQLSASGNDASNFLMEFETLAVIGSGSFGRIVKVLRKWDGKIMARKEVDYRRMKEKERRQLVQEVNILRELIHPNIVRYQSRFVDRDNYLIYIMMEFCEGGDLATVIKRARQEKCVASLQ